jgi:uncharacterized protein YjiS (DUF1127 family)
MISSHLATGASRRSLGSTVFAIVRLLQSWSVRWPSRRTIRILHKLSDSQLKDIGLRRAEIDGRFGGWSANCPRESRPAPLQG